MAAPERFADSQIPLAPRAPSIHDPKETLRSTGSVSSTRTGYAVGAGVEYAFDNHWIGGVEYIYANLGRVNFNTAVLPGFATFTNAFSGKFADDIFAYA